MNYKVVRKRKVAELPDDEDVDASELAACTRLFSSLVSTLTFITEQGAADVHLEQLLKQNFGKEDILNVLKLKILAPDLLEYSLVDRADLAVSFYEPTYTAASKVIIVRVTDGKKAAKDGKKRRTSVEVIGKIVKARQKAFSDAAKRYHRDCILRRVSLAEELAVRAESLAELLGTGIPLCASDTRALPFSINSENCQQSLESLLIDLQNQPFYKNQIVEDGWIIRNSKSPTYGTLNPPISGQLQRLIKESKGLENLYEHQCQAVNALADCKSRSVILCTRTSSGKSLVYQLAILRQLEEEPSSCALLLFPTKALAQDQLRSFKEFGEAAKLAACYDGDTTTVGQTRKNVRENSQFIFSNLDMLHSAILPNHQLWGSRFFGNLRLVVIDELHYYNGALGAHASMILRRLVRICSLYNNNQLRFVSSTATIVNPQEHAKKICGVEPAVVDVDGSPRSRMHFVSWDPVPAQSSSIYDTCKLCLYFMERNLRVIVFCKFRRSCELLLKQVRENLPSNVRDELVSGYRGGYDPKERREIERRLFSGQLRAVIATNALELGVDIGSLDVVLHMGFPFSLSSYWQQSGRVGRRANREALSVLIAERGNPLDDWWIKRPRELLTSSAEECAIDVENVLVVEPHLQCAAYERGLSEADVKKFFSPWISVVEQNLQYNKEDGLYYPKIAACPVSATPASLVAIRAIDEGEYSVVDVASNQLLERMELARAMFTLFEGAIFLNQGKSFLVIKLDAVKGCAFVRPTAVPWTTVPRDLNVADPVEIRKNSLAILYYGDIDYYRLIFGYHKIDRDGKIVESIAQETPLTSIHKATRGVWIMIPKVGVDRVVDEGIDVHWAMHAAQHALLGLVPRYILSSSASRCEMRCECRSPKAKRVRPHRLVLFDTMQNPGISLALFSHLPDLVEMACTAMSLCDCVNGCLSCGVVLAECMELNQALDKRGAVFILESIREHLRKQSDIVRD